VRTHHIFRKILGAVHKRCPHKIAKKWPSFTSSENCPCWLNSLLYPCWVHTINLENFEVLCTKKCRRPHLKTPALCQQNVRIGSTPSSPLDCGRLLWTASWVLLNEEIEQLLALLR